MQSGDAAGSSVSTGGIFHELKHLLTYGEEIYALGTWNVQGIKDKLPKILSEIKAEDTDVIVLTETKLKGKGKKIHEEYIQISSGVNINDHARAGVSILIKKNLDSVTLVDWNPVNERIITAELNVRGQKVIIIGIYWVDGNAILETKEKFQEAFRNELVKWEGHELIILGDFNSKVGTSTISKVVGEFGVEVKDNNGGRLIKICEKFKLRIQNTFFYHEDIRKYTRYGKNRNGKESKSLIDFCITRQDTRLYVHDVLACRWLECKSDHIFLETTISIPIKNYSDTKMDLSFIFLLILRILLYMLSKARNWSV